MANREHADFVEVRQETIKRQVASLAEGDDEPPELARDRPTDQRVVREHRNRRPNGCRGAHRRLRILLAQVFERALEVVERPPRVDYRRHGRGRGRVTFRLLASLCNQACTSSAL